MTKIYYKNHLRICLLLIIMTHQCNRCGEVFMHNYLLLKHLRRKKECVPVLNDISYSQLLFENENRQDKKYECKMCKKKFINRQSKYVHQKTCDKEPNKIINITAPINYNSNNVQTNNIQNNINIYLNSEADLIKLRDFAINENTKYMKPEFLLECFRQMDMIKVIEEMNFNPEHPENHNVRIKNQNQNLMEFYQNGKWLISKKNDILFDLIMNGYRVLNTYYKNNKEDVEYELDDEEIYDSLAWLKKIYNEDKNLIKELKNDAFLLVINNKALLLKK